MGGKWGENGGKMGENGGKMGENGGKWVKMGENGGKWGKKGGKGGKGGKRRGTGGNSPDLDLIENVWEWMKQKLTNSTATNLTDWKKEITELWATMYDIDKPEDPRRVHAQEAPGCDRQRRGNNQVLESVLHLCT